MQMNIQNTRGVGVRQGVKMLTYGGAGRGKTTLCSTAPSPIILSAESGLLSLAGFDLPYIEINTVDDLTAAYNWCVGSQEARQFQTVCLDSLTEIGEVVLANAKAQTKDPRQAYGELIDKMGNTIRAFRDIPGYHVYMSAKQETTKDDHTGVTTTGPSMPGAKLGPSLPYMFDEVFYLGIGEMPDPNNPGARLTYRYLQTQPDFQNVAKDRSGRLEDIEEPHLGKIIDKITQQ